MKVKAPAKVKRGKVAVFKVTVTGPGVTPGGTVAVKIAGQTQTVKLNKAGQATVEVRIKKSAKPGKRKVKVSYSGDSYVAKRASKNTTVRIIR